MKRWFVIPLLLIFCMPIRVGAEQEEEALREQLERAGRTDNADSLALAYRWLGEYYGKRSADTALYYNELALKMLTGRTDTLYAIVLGNMGFNYFVKGDMDAAMDCYRRVCQAAFALQDTARWSSALSSMGAIYRRQAKGDSCLLCYENALRLIEHSSNYVAQANLSGNIALQYMSAQKDSVALAFGRKAVELANKSRDMETIMYTGYVYSSICFRKGLYDEGIQTIHDITSKASRRNMPGHMLRCYRLMLQMFDRRGMRDSVNHYMNEIDSVLGVLPADTREGALALEQQAVIYAKYRNFRKSMETYHKLLRYDAKGRLTTDKIYLGIARNYSSMRDYLRAMKYYDRSVKAADSLHADKQNQLTADFNARLEAKNRELSEAMRRQEVQAGEIRFLGRMLYSTLAIVGLVIAGMLFWSRKRSNCGKQTS